MFAEAHGLRGDVVRCSWDRLMLHLTSFAESGDRWVPVERGVRSLHLRVGKQFVSHPVLDLGDT